jgi:D-alanyl-D-alanine carboxypeptidase
MPTTRVLQSLLFCAAFAIGALSSASCATAADARLDRARGAIKEALPPEVAAAVLGRVEASSARFLDLLAAVSAERAAEPYLLRRLDKAVAISESYAPTDLVSLDGKGLSVSRAGFKLRKPAFDALVAMDKAARAEGLALVLGSAYRSYAYQVGVWDRGVAAEGEAATAKVIALPGHSQHQLGMAIDFGSIDDSFAATKASRWLAANARRFGFSLSYPKGREGVTGYSWESWHYRYIGKAAAALEAEFFEGMQQYLVLFAERWKD